MKGGTVDGGSGSVSCDVFADESSLTVSGGKVQSDAAGAAVKVKANATSDGYYGKVTLSGGTLTLAEGSAVYAVAGDNVKDLLPADCAFAASGSKVKLTDVTVANTLTVVTCDHKDADNNPAAGTDGRCSYCGTNCNDGHTVRLTHGESTSGYVNFADAQNAAADGDTLQLLAGMTETLSISKAVTLDLNGKSVSSLTVSESATVIDSAGGGVIDSLMIDVSGLTVGGLLESGYGFKAADGTWYDKSSTATNLSNVEVKKLPITSVSITADGTKPDGKDYYTYTYGDQITLTATATLATDYASATPAYQWTAINSSTVSGTEAEYKPDTLNATYDPAVGIIDGTDSYGYQCVVTVDGYSLTAAVTFYVAKAQLDYDPPTAKENLTYSPIAHQPINAGTIKTENSGATMYYRPPTGPYANKWITDASSIKHDSAGKITVHWYIDGGTNYQSVGSQENPAGTITATIAPMTLTLMTSQITVATGSTYDGTEQRPTVSVAYAVPLYQGTDYTVAYENNINAGDQAKVTVTAKDGSNFTFEPVTKTFSIAKAAISSFTPPAPNNTDYNGSAQQLIAAAGSATGGTFHYRLGESGEWTTDITTLTATDAGSYIIYYYVEGDANHLDNGTQASPAGHITASISRIDLAVNCTVTLDPATYTYDGTMKTPTVTVTYKGKPLTEGTDYTVTGQTSGTEVEGSYRMQVEATDNGNFTGQKPVDWSITAAPLTVTGVTAANKSYDGTTGAAVSVTFGGLVNGETLTAGTDYTVSGSFNNSNAGTDKTVTAAVTLLSTNTTKNYTLTGSVPTTRAAINQKVVGLSWTNTDLTYNGSAQKPTATATGLVNGDTCTVTVRGAQTNAGGNYTATAAALSNSNYKLPEANTTTFSIAQASSRTLTDIPVSQKYSVTSGEKVLGNVGMPDDAGTLTYSKGTASTTGSVLVGNDWNVDTDGKVTYTLIGGAAGNTVTLQVKINSDNYAESTVNVVVTLTDKDTPTVTANDITVTYTGSAVPATAITGTATFNGTNVAGTWSFTSAAPVNVSDSSDSVGVTFTPTDGTNYSTVATTIKVTIAKATPTGEPTYTAITTSGKTLSDAALTANTSWPDGTVQWVDADGSELEGTTTVAANTAYKWQFTPASDNYNSITGTVTLWHKSGGGSSSGSSGTTITVPVSSDSATVNVKAEVSKGNATVSVSDAQIDKVANDGAGEVTVDVSGLKNVDSATVPSHVVEKTNEAEDTGLTVALPTGSVTLDETALESVTENADGKDVTVSVVSIPTSKLPEVVKEVIGMEPTVAAVVDVNITVNGKNQSSFSGGKLTVTIPYTPKKGEDTSKLTVWFIKDDGTIENKGGWYDAKNKCFVFETDHLSQYLLVNTNELVTFTDVPASAYFYTAVNWAAAQGITGGVDDTHFAPNNACTRAQIVTFLYRWAVANGVDVSVGEDTNILSYNDAFSIPEYAISAFQWAVGAGILQGNGGNLMPNQTCTRAQAVAFLFRFAQSTGMDTSVGEDTNILSYNDAFNVPEYAISAFQWAVGAGIVQGNDGNLMPNQTCTRAQIVTFLYRFLGE